MRTHWSVVACALGFLTMVTGLGCGAAPDPTQTRTEGASICSSATSDSATSQQQACGAGCSDTCSSQAIGEPGGSFSCSRPTSCGIWPWCPTATVVTGPLDSPQCECQCK